jgi:hypothetical protein
LEFCYAAWYRVRRSGCSLLALAVKDKETVNVQVWTGVVTMVAGVILFFVRKQNQFLLHVCRAGID